MTSPYGLPVPHSSGIAASRVGGALALALAAPLLLLGCAVEDESSVEPTAPAAEPSATSGEPSPSSSATPGESESDVPTATGPGSEIPDPDALDVERTEELGAFFSEEEACMAIGSMIDGLHTDMENGVEEQEALDEAYEAVEQTYLLAPEELREPLENILGLLDSPVDDLDEEEVLVAAEPVDGWLTVEYCDGEYHTQNHGDDQ